jgi:hypothetical protein
MKQQAIQYLALDVHQASVVATLRGAQGSILMRATVPTEATAIVRLSWAARVPERLADCALSQPRFERHDEFTQALLG